MGINRLSILALMSLTCLFSFSTSTPTYAPSPYSEYASRDLREFMSQDPSASRDLRESMSKAPSASDGVEIEYNVLNILPGGVDPALQQICANTDHPIECIMITTLFIDEKAPIEPLPVLKAGIQAINNKTKDALAEVTKLSQAPTTPTGSVPVLETCIEVYNSILDNDQKALEAISKRNLVLFSRELGASMENALGCDQAFKQAKVESPMKEKDELLAKTISNTLTIGLDLVHF